VEIDRQLCEKFALVKVDGKHADQFTIFSFVSKIFEGGSQVFHSRTKRLWCRIVRNQKLLKLNQKETQPERGADKGSVHARPNLNISGAVAMRLMPKVT
jgi:hypothetical protein